MAAEKVTTPRGYPLVALFLVLTACCVVAALVSPAMRGVFEGKIGASEAGTAAIAGGIFTMALGAGVGLFHYHRARGFGWGLVTGAVIGAFIGPMVLVPAQGLSTMLGLSIGGAVVLVLVAVAFRYAAR